MMRTNKLLAATALAGSLAMATLMWSSAKASPVPTGSHAFSNSSVTLVAAQGGGGGGGGGAGSGGGGGHISAGGGGGGPATASGGPRGGGPGMGGGPRAGGHAMNEGGGSREFNREGSRDHGDRGRFVEGDRDHRHAERGHDHDHDFDNRGRHRVFRNGVWVWVYGPDYSYNDCGWLRVRALDTGSPYWWNRYHYCVGY